MARKQPCGRSLAVAGDGNIVVRGTLGRHNWAAVAEFLLLLLLAAGASTTATFLDQTSTTTTKSHVTTTQFILSPSYSLPNYVLMLSSFKIYVYPRMLHSVDLRSPIFPSPPSSQLLFLQSLSSSCFLTHDPEPAHLFFVPVSLHHMLQNTSVSVGRNLKAFLQQLRDLYPYWQRTLGADHFVTSCHRFKSDDSRNVLELQKNSIWLACAQMFGSDHAAAAGKDVSSQSGSDSQFFPHKDVTMPPYRAHKINFSHYSAITEHQDRSVLVYLIDASHPSALQSWKHDSDFVFAHENPESTAYPEMLATSKFCLTFASMGAHNRSLVDGMRLGCVPVIVANGYLQGVPFQDILDWQRFSVIASTTQLHQLKAYLKTMPEANYRELQEAAMVAAGHFEWNTPPRPYDAFHLLMYQLWLRRHTIRYKRRSIQ